MKVIRVGVTSYAGYVSECLFGAKSVFDDCPDPGIAVQAARILQTLLKGQYQFRLISLQEEQKIHGPWASLVSAFNQNRIDTSLDLLFYNPHRGTLALFPDSPLLYADNVYIFSTDILSHETPIFDYTFDVRILLVLIVSSIILGALHSPSVHLHHQLRRSIDFFTGFIQPASLPSPNFHGHSKYRDMALRVTFVLWLFGGFFFICWYGAWLKTDFVRTRSPPFQNTKSLSRALSSKQLSIFVSHERDSWLINVRREATEDTKLLAAALRKNPPIIKPVSNNSEFIRIMNQFPTLVHPTSESYFRFLSSDRTIEKCRVSAVRREDSDTYYGLHMGFRPGFPHFQEFNKHIRRFGPVIRALIIRSLPEPTNCQGPETQEYADLSSRYLQNTFWFLLFGFTVATCCFALELHTKKYKRSYSIVADFQHQLPLTELYNV